MVTRAHELDAWIWCEDRHGPDAWHEGRHEDVYGEEFHMHLEVVSLLWTHSIVNRGMHTLSLIPYVGLASSNTREGWQ
jgi:hypothetical protein